MKSEPISSWTFVMPLAEFVANVKCGAFTDYDGFGYYSNGIVEFSEHPVNLFKILNNTDPLNDTFTHVCWYNK